MPKPLGKEVIIPTYVYDNHAGNKITQISHIGIIIFINNALIQVFFKRQNNVESSTFVSEIVSLRIGRDLVSALRIKLKCFGVLIRGSANVFSDNESLYKHLRNPESTINKNHNSTKYHVCREAVVAGIMRVGKEDTHMNPSDAFEKLMPYSNKRGLLLGILWGYLDGYLWVSFIG